MSQIDFTSGYWQVALHEDSRDLLTLNSFYGSFRPTVMMFGTKCSARGFQYAMNKIFEGLLYNTVSVYLDDGLFADPSIEQHVASLKKGFERLRKANAKLEPSKCNFNYQKLCVR
jgi:hypothetical protein